MSLSNLMNIARSALTVQQRALDVTGHNIANANTPGYSRQRLVLEAEVPLRTPLGTVGRGVTAGATTAMRDALLDAAVRREQGSYAQADTLRQQLQRIEAVLDEPSENGLAARLDALFGAFAELADRPTTGAARVGVRAAADAVARQLNALDARLADEEAAIQGAFRSTVDRINALAGQIADLNREIVAAGSPPRSAPDLVDARGVLLDELSGLVGIRVLDRPDGSVGVVAGDVLLVDGAYRQTLEARLLVGGGIGAGVVGSTRLMVPGGGALRALGELGTDGVRSVRVELDRLAADLVASVNTIHAGGTTLGGDTGVALFEPSGTTAGTMRLSAAVAASPDQVVAGNGVAGDNSVAQALAALRTTARPGLNGQSPGNFYASVVTSLGTIVQDADRGARAAEVILSGAQARRASVTGVSTDEEMVTLIQQQQAFAAAARLVNVADEVLQDILRLV
jgi:flagellar hook-associated protein 1